MSLGKKLRSKRGQAMVETVMLLSIVMAVWLGLSKAIKERGIFQKLFGEPWTRISNVIEFGIPSSGARSAVGPMHPAAL